MKLNAPLAALSVLLTLASSPASANAIVNGNFQTGDLTGWSTYLYSGSSTLGSGLPAVVSFDTTGSGASLAAEFDVGNASTCCATSGGGLTQTFTAASAGVYEFHLDFASQNDATGQINGDPGTFSIIEDGNTIATQSPSGFETQYEILRGNLDAFAFLTAGSHTIDVQVTRNSAAGGVSTPTEFIDNVSVNASAAPEPASAAFLAIGLLAIGYRRHSGRADRKL
jgi:hypothetical protein